MDDWVAGSQSGVACCDCRSVILIAQMVTGGIELGAARVSRWPAAIAVAGDVLQLGQDQRSECAGAGGGGIKRGGAFNIGFKRGVSVPAANEIAPGAGALPNSRMRCLGIDYGSRRIGLSFGDDIGVATPLPALVQSMPEDRWSALRDVISQRRITDLVLGYPFNMDGSAGFKAKEVDAFAERLRTEFGLPVHFVDERLTSYEAESTIAKVKRRDVRASGLIDSRAATIILQDYLDQKLPPVEFLEEDA
jgi:putative Holliday junction resolvase